MPRSTDGALMHGGAQYYIRGVGGQAYLDTAKAHGANSIRTWSEKNLGKVLDDAHSHGMTVCVGLWLKHASSGPDLFDSPSRAADRAEILNGMRSTVREFAHHPSVLMWMVGNEANAEGYSDFAPLYSFINEAALAVKEADGEHLVGTVTTSPTPAIARCLLQHAPAVDVWGVNVYGSLLSRLPAKMREVGWAKPYVVTEFGPTNWWQVGSTSWGARIEPDSSAKAATYGAAAEAMAADSELCLGGYAFKWGWKEQYGVTWVNIVNAYPYALSGGETTAALDEISKSWTGAYPPERAPVIGTNIRINGEAAAASVTLPPAARATAQVGAASAAGGGSGGLRYQWRVLPELGKLKEAPREGLAWDGAKDPAPVAECAPAETVPGAATFTAPSAVGYYRLYVWVTSASGRKFATDNIPFAVSDAPTPAVVRASAAAFVRDGEFAQSNFYEENSLATKCAEGKQGKGYERVALLRFEVPAAAQAAGSVRAEMRLLCTAADKASREVRLHALEDQNASWDERRVTAATAPRWSPDPVAAAATQGPGWVSFDVSAFVGARAAAGAKVVQVAVVNAGKSEKAHAWAARDEATGLHVPELRVSSSA